MQFTAMGFFVARMAGSAHQAALDLGILGASRAVPVLLLSPPAGVVADHLPRRRVLLVTNTTMALAALLLARPRDARTRSNLHGLGAPLRAELGGQRLRFADAAELGTVAGGSPLHRQRRRASTRSRSTRRPSSDRRLRAC